MSDHKQDCFCGKFLKRFLGDEVNLLLVNGDELFEVTIACIDEKSGVVTITDGGDISYICCKSIVAVLPAAASV